MGLYLRGGPENQSRGVEKTYRYTAGQHAVPNAGSGAVQYGDADAGRTYLNRGERAVYRRDCR